MDTQPGRATRLTIEYNGDDMKVISSRSVKMIVPDSDDRHNLKGLSGFWVELQSAEHECLYRKVMSEPMLEQMEAPSGDPEKPFTRTAPSRRKGVFSLLVPEMPDARQLYLCKSPATDRLAPAQPFAIIDLRNPTAEVQKIGSPYRKPSSKSSSGQSSVRRKK
jgi:hypothetical protein